MHRTAVRSLPRRAALAITAATALVASATGVAAAASAPPSLAWTDASGATVGSYDFGTLDAGAGQSAAQTFTLTNGGGHASGTIAVTLTGAPAFTLTADTCTGLSLGPGRSCTATVSYAPTYADASDSAALDATAEHASASLALTGSSGVPVFSLSPGQSEEPSSVHNTYYYVFKAPTYAQTFTVTNTGTGTSGGLAVRMDGDPEFSLSNDTVSGAVLAPGQSATFDLAVSCTDTVPSLSAQVDITDPGTNDSVELDAFAICL